MHYWWFTDRVFVCFFSDYEIGAYPHFLSIILSSLFHCIRCWFHLSSKLVFFTSLLEGWYCLLSHLCIQVLYWILMYLQSLILISGQHGNLLEFMLFCQLICFSTVKKGSVSHHQNRNCYSKESHMASYKHVIQEQWIHCDITGELFLPNFG